MYIYVLNCYILRQIFHLFAIIYLIISLLLLLEKFFLIILNLYVFYIATISEVIVRNKWLGNTTRPPTGVFKLMS